MWWGKEHKQLQGVGVDVWMFPVAVNATEGQDLVDECEKFSFCMVQPKMVGSLGEECGAGWT